MAIIRMHEGTADGVTIYSKLVPKTKQILFVFELMEKIQDGWFKLRLGPSYTISSTSRMLITEAVSLRSTIKKNGTTSGTTVVESWWHSPDIMPPIVKTHADLNKLMCPSLC